MERGSVIQGITVDFMLISVKILANFLLEELLKSVEDLQKKVLPNNQLQQSLIAILRHNPLHHHNPSQDTI
jgi:hypothetical protein